MKKEVFKDKLNDELKELELNEIKDLINYLVDNIPSKYYEYLLCKIQYFKGEDYKINDEILNKYNEILEKFKQIEDGDICVRCYPCETGTYSYYDADVDYLYYPSSMLKKVLVDTYNLIEELVLYKEYDKVITLFELITKTEYTCEEVGDHQYDDTDEVYDIYEIDFNEIKEDLEIDLDKACLYAIYSLIMTNKPNKFEKIYEYTKICYKINIKDVQNIGIEKINNFDKFYSEWIKYLETKDKNK